MKRENITQNQKIIDVRQMPQDRRNLRLLEAMLCLEPGCSFVIMSEEHPAALIGHLENELSGRFLWWMEQDGPELWLLQVARKSHHELCDIA